MTAVAEPQVLPKLPGCVRSISLFPEPRWPIALRNVRALHGVLTKLWGKGHKSGPPNFAILPWPHAGGCCGWAVQWIDETSRALPTQHHVSVFSEHRILTLGPPIQYRAPMLLPPGEHLLRLETITPVVIRARIETPDGRERYVYREEARAEHIAASLWQSAWLRLAIGSGPELSPPQLEVVSSKTHVEEHLVGDPHWGGNGRLRGWAGELVLRADSSARYFLEAAQLLGLGRNVSIGFGRIRVREVTR